MTDEQLRADFQKWASLNTNWNPVWNGEQYQERDHELAWIGYQARVPAGYCVVPVEATEAMISAALCEIGRTPSHEVFGNTENLEVARAYRAMIAAIQPRSIEDVDELRELRMVKASDD